jgi:hypothetical protein
MSKLTRKQLEEKAIIFLTTTCYDSGLKAWDIDTYGKLVLYYKNGTTKTIANY